MGLGPVKDCPFCSLPPERIVWQSDLVVVIRDAYPVSQGHTLVIPKQHVETYFDAFAGEQTAIWDAVERVQADLDEALDPPPDGYNVGFNSGEAAGQTVMHLHIHVIPRWKGDVEDPRGGIRGVIPGKQRY
jgi:diadenosine tetraphosphate (Ap4A) HIT family hydrolase